MFDDQNELKVSNSAGTAGSKSTVSSQSQQPVTPNTKPAPAVQSQQTAPAFGKDAEEEVEDIFSGPGRESQPGVRTGSQLKGINPADKADSASKTQVRLTPEGPVKVEGKQKIDEPVIKNTPGTIMPSTPPTPEAGKKGVILAIILILAAGATGVAIWWFLIRDSQSITSAPQLTDLADGMDDNIDIEDKDDTVGYEEKQEPRISDSDGDGLTDEEESLLGTSINNVDTDNDGLFDREEVKIYKTDPMRSDTDGDGVDDGSEVKNGMDPLLYDAAKEDGANNYLSRDLKISFTYPPEMVLEYFDAGLIRFNDNINQIKLYIYVNNDNYGELKPDISYDIDESINGKLEIAGSTRHEDMTPVSTEYNTGYYRSNNGNSYLIKYTATKRADNHRQNFENLLNSINFLK